MIDKIENLNNPIHTEEIESVIKIFVNKIINLRVLGFTS